MAIQNFTCAEFEQALPSGKWADMGIDGKTHQRLYSVTPYTDCIFAILVFSSIKADGASSAEAGGDSIRAVITREGKPFGGKSVRWIARSNGWQERLLRTLKILTEQIMWLKSVRCSCGKELVPFTVRKKDSKNKNRPFVTCVSPTCNNQFYQWTRNENDEYISPNANKTAARKQEENPIAPACPKCSHSPMVRMARANGWRCATPGNRWDNGAWTVCDGVIWDDNSAKPTAVVNPTPAKPTALPSPIRFGCAPTIIPSPAKPTSVVGFNVDGPTLLKEIKRALALLDEGDIEETERALRALIK